MDNRSAFVYQLKHNGNVVYLNEDGYTTELADAAMFPSLAQAVDFIWNIPIEKYAEMGLDDAINEQKKHLADLREVIMMDFNQVEVRYFPCFTIKDDFLGETTGFFDADDCSYFNENDRGIVVDSEQAFYVYNRLTKKDIKVFKTLYQNLVDGIAANPDDSLKVTDFRFEKEYLM